MGVFNISYEKTHKIIKILGIKIKLRLNNSDKFTYSSIADEIYIANAVRDLHSKVFPPFKNLHNDENITIVGCGPSVEYYNNEADYHNIALNKAILLKNINYDYTFAFDKCILETCPNYMEEIRRNKNCKHFIGRFLYPDFYLNFPELDKKNSENVYRYYSSKRWCLPDCNVNQPIYPNIESFPLCDFFSVSFAALQFALYTYPKKIYLVGLDTHSIVNFWDGEDPVGFGYEFSEMIKGYKKFKQFKELYYPQTEIISINPVGLKGLFKDVYTQSYVDAHPELLQEDITIIQ